MKIATMLYNSRNINILMIFVEHGFDVNLLNGIILECAILDGNISNIKNLLDRSADPNIGFRQMPLLIAIDLRNESIINLLLDYGADIKCIDTKLLAQMVNFGSIEFIKLLGKYSVDLTMLNDYNYTNINTTNKINYLMEIGIDAIKIVEIMNVNMK